MLIFKAGVRFSVIINIGWGAGENKVFKLSPIAGPTKYVEDKII